MANTLLTPSIIAREAIIALENEMVMANLIHRDFSEEFARVGDTVTVRKPATFVAQEWNGSTVTIQDAVESGVPVAMNKIIDVSFAVTAKELSLSIQDFSEQFIRPAVRAHAQYLDSWLLSLYRDIPYFVDVSSTPSISDWANLDKMANINKIPVTERRCVLGPSTKAKYIVMDAFLHAEKSGTTDALRDANMGRVMTFDVYHDQNVHLHTAGGVTVKINKPGGYPAGTRDIHVDGVTTALVVGDLLTITGGQYVVTAAGALSGSAQDISIYPGLRVNVANDDDVTVRGSHYANIAFHRNAFALVSRPLAPPLGANRAETLTYNGISLRVVYDYDMNTKRDTISIDFLAGIKCLTPELAVRFCESVS